MFGRMSKSGVSAQGMTPRAVVVAVQVCLLMTCCKERDMAEEPAEAVQEVGAYHNVNDFQLHNEVYGTGIGPQANAPGHHAAHPVAYPAVAQQVYMQQFAEYLQYMKSVGYGGEDEWGQPASVMLAQDPAVVQPSAAMTGVKELDRWTAGDVVGSEQGVFLILYTKPTECPFCVALAPQLRELGLHFQTEPAVVIAKADAVTQRPLVEEYGMTDAPLPTALYFAPGATKPVVYDGPAHHTSMIEFLEDHVPGILKDGQLAAMRPLARNFMAAATDSVRLSVREEATAAHAGFVAEQDTTAADRAQRYLAVMDRVAKHGNSWLAAQKSSLLKKVLKLRQDSLTPLPADPDSEPQQYMEQVEALNWQMVRLRRQVHVVEEFLFLDQPDQPDQPEGGGGAGAAVG